MIRAVFVSSFYLMENGTYVILQAGYQWKSLILLTNTLPPSSSLEPDRPFWMSSSSGVFMVASAYAALGGILEVKSTHNSSLWNLVWK